MYTYRKDDKGWSVFSDGWYLGSVTYAKTKEQALKILLEPQGYDMSQQQIDDRNAMNYYYIIAKLLLKE